MSVFESRLPSEAIKQIPKLMASTTSASVTEVVLPLDFLVALLARVVVALAVVSMPVSVSIPESVSVSKSKSVSISISRNEE